ncbi:MAG TPA: prepilin-type N-terminal cleavage/methylation domain-containing protein [Candidatus Paceibacterota bacterium]|nr:prepilin-type N-terminal cleavage/methylation domain-containing protein [Candidatus Paceibacterota bacterium]
MKRYSKGFSLIELLVVIALIALLSSMITSTLTSARAKARDARRKHDIDQIKIALEIYADLKGFLPQTSAYGESNTSGIDSSAQGDFIPFLATSSIFSKVPRDPINNNTGSAATTANGYAYGYYCYPPAHGSNPFAGFDTVTLWYPSELTNTVTRIDYRAPAPCQ